MQTKAAVILLFQSPGWSRKSVPIVFEAVTARGLVKPFSCQYSLTATRSGHDE
jgi:hypothetical protein